MAWKQLSATIAVLALATGPAAAQLGGALPSALCAGWQGERTCELLHEDEMIRVLRCTFPPGVGHEAHYHPPHFGYALEGQSIMRITTENGVVDRAFQAGASFANDSEVRHAAVNVGGETMRYLIVEKKYADARPAGAIEPGLCATDRAQP